MKEYGGLSAVFDRNSGRIFFEKVIECHRVYSKYQCDKDGSRKTLASSCGFRLCAMCLPSRLLADFKKHGENLQERQDLYIWTPPAGKVTRKEIGAAFNHWRRSNGVTAGVYGVRLTTGKPDVLLMVPAGTAVPLPACSTRIHVRQVIAWWTDRYLEEAMSWKTPEEMGELLGRGEEGPTFSGVRRALRKEQDRYGQLRVIVR